MIRLDKYLCDMGIGTRSSVKELIRKGNIKVNDMVVKSSDYKIKDSDIVLLNDNQINYQKFYYYMLNKPAGYISATTDKKEKTVMDLLGEYNRKDLFPIGRLDKDTEGLLILSNDGELSHNLLSPKKHVSKTYLVSLEVPITDEDILNIEKGVDIGEDKLTLPTNIEKINDTELYISITVGKYHQVKRMFSAVGNKVVYLKRVAMGKLKLDDTLAPGELRPLSEQEINLLNISNKEM